MNSIATICVHVLIPLFNLSLPCILTYLLKIFRLSNPKTCEKSVIFVVDMGFVFIHPKYREKLIHVFLFFLYFGHL